MPKTTFAEAFKQGKFGNTPGQEFPTLGSSTVQQPTTGTPQFSQAKPEQLESLGIDTGAIDLEVNQQIENKKAKKLTIDQFYDKVDQLKEYNQDMTNDELVKFGLELAKEKGYIIDGINIDEELGFTPEVKQADIPDKTLGENISSIGDTLKIGGSEEFGGVQSIKDILTAGINLPGDTIEGIGELTNLITSPLDTITSLKDLSQALSDKLVFSVLNKISGQDKALPEQSKAITDALGQQLKENFGTLGKAKKTFVENPVDTLFFLKGALGTVGKITKSSKLVSIANKIDPIAMQTKPVGGIIKGGKSVVQEGLGKVTGLGKEGVQDIMKLGKTEEFGKAIKGGIKPTEVVDDVAEAITKLKGDASKKFGADLDKILKTGDVKVNFNTKIDDFFNSLKENKGVKVTKGKNGKYSIKEGPNTRIIEEDLAILQKITDRINLKSGDITGIEARALINRIGSESSKLQDKGVLLDFKKNLTNTLEEASPGFKQMNKDYRTMTTTVKNLEDTFGSSTTKLETKINKLNQALRDNQDYKKYMLSIIEESSGKNIKGTLAGLAARQILPRGLIGQIGAGGAAAALAGGASIIPVILTLGIASPRLLGTISRGLGITSDKLKSFIDLAKNNLPKSAVNLPVKETIKTGVKGAGTVGATLDTTK